MEPVSLFYEKRAQILLKNLRARHFDACYCPDRASALAAALRMIPHDALVGWGGARSADQIGLQQAIEDVRAQIGPETLILSPLNGVESEEVVAKTYGWENIVYSLMRISSVKVGNTVSFDPNAAFYVEYGEKKNDPANLSERVLRLKALFDGAGIRYQIRPDMLLAIWEKFACNVSENQVAAVLDLPYGAWGSCEDAEALRIMVAAEVIEIAQKKGIPIETNYARDHLDVIKAVPPRNKPSTLQDILAGRKTEVDIFAGAVIRFGKEYGVPTPYNEFLYHAIRVLEAKNAGTVEGV